MDDILGMEILYTQTNMNEYLPNEIINYGFYRAIDLG